MRVMPLTCRTQMTNPVFLQRGPVAQAIVPWTASWGKSSNRSGRRCSETIWWSRLPLQDAMLSAVAVILDEDRDWQMLVRQHRMPPG